VSFADLELVKQGVGMEPVLQAISTFLDDNQEIIKNIEADLRRGLKNPDTGRNGLTPQQVLRSLVLMRVKDFDYRELRERVADGYTCDSSPISILSRFPSMMRSNAHSSA
jgi:IS5 family transposase